MAWVRIDDEFPEHPKLLKAGPLAMLMQVAALCYCNRHLTDGFIPESKVATLINLDGLGDWRNVLSDLLREGIWERVDGGYMIHDYLDYQPSREEVLADRESAHRRAAMNANPALARALKERDGNRCRYCGRVVDWKNRKGEQGATYDHIIPIHKGGTESVDNIVVCCRACNLKKGARTPEEAGMTLLPPPSQHHIDTKQESRRNLDGIQTESRPPIPIPNNISLTRDNTSHVTQREIESANADSMPLSAAPPSEPSQEVGPYPKPVSVKSDKPAKAGVREKKPRQGRTILPEAWDLAAEIIDDMRRNDGTPPRDKEKLRFASAIDKLMRARDSPADAEEIRAMWEWAKTDKEVTKIRTWPGRLADCLASYRARQQYEQMEYERRKRL